MEFPNSFENWYESFFEVTTYIEERLRFYDNNDGNEVEEIHRRVESEGRGGLYLLAKEWTDEFEELNKGREWDGEFFDEIDEFLIKKNLHCNPQHSD